MTKLSKDELEDIYFDAIDLIESALRKHRLQQKDYYAVYAEIIAKLSRGAQHNILSITDCNKVSNVEMYNFFVDQFVVPIKKIEKTLQELKDELNGTDEVDDISHDVISLIHSRIEKPLSKEKYRKIVSNVISHFVN